MAFVLGFIFGIVTLASVIVGVGFFYMYANRELFPHGSTAPRYSKHILRPNPYASPKPIYSSHWSSALYKKKEDSDEPESDDGLADTDEEV